MNSEEPWPTFLIVGAPKAGTTSLTHYLRDHPDVRMADLKEPKYFARHNERVRSPEIGPVVETKSEYLSLFEYGPGVQARGEASVCYLWAPEAAREIADTVPEVRIVVLLRDPVERAYSHYHDQKVKGHEDRPFLEAIRHHHLEEIPGGYVSAGRYATHLERFVDVLGREQILAVPFDEFTTDTETQVMRVADFVGVSSKAVDGIGTDVVWNPARKPRGDLVGAIYRSSVVETLLRRIKQVSPVRVPKLLRALLMEEAPKPPMDPKARRFLEELYDEEMRRTEDLLRTPLPGLRPDG